MLDSKEKLFFTPKKQVGPNYIMCYGKGKFRCWCVILMEQTCGYAGGFAMC